MFFCKMLLVVREEDKQKKEESCNWKLKTETRTNIQVEKKMGPALLFVSTTMVGV